MKTEVTINKDMILWAIARAGHDLHEFLLSAPNINKWIEEDKKPTVKQLEKFSKKVHIPFGYLFLQSPPDEKLPIPFFRTENNSNEKVSLNVYDTILLMQSRQEWLRNYFIDSGFSAHSFVGKFDLNSDYKDIVNDIRAKLHLGENWTRSFQTWVKALDHLTNTVEESGIILSCGFQFYHYTCVGPAWASSTDSLMFEDPLNYCEQCHTEHNGDTIWLIGFTFSYYNTIGFQDPISEDVVVKAYPNPVNDIITFDMENINQQSELIIYNSFGQMIWKEQIGYAKQNYKINISDYKSGIYYYQITLSNSQKKYSGKFVKL
jgi:hypothetical protein